MAQIPFLEELLKLSQNRYAEMQKQVMITCIKCADAGTHDIFYSSCKPQDPVWTGETDQMKAAFTEAAIRCTAQAICSAGVNHLNQAVTENREEIKKWLESSSDKYGPSVFRKTLNTLGFERYFQDQAGWQNMIQILSSPVYLTGTLVSLLSSSQEQARFILGAISSYNAEDGRRVAAAWKSCQALAALTEIIARPPSWFSAYAADVPGFVRNFEAEVRQACARTTKSETFQQQENVTIGDTGICVYDLVTYQRDYHGEDVLEWIRSKQGAGKYGLTSGKSIDITTVSQVSSTRKISGTGCVLVDTDILMADGRTKKIQDLKEGDTVMSRERNYSIFSGELVHTPDIKAFYSINGSRAMFSLDHAVGTRQGWKSLAPEVSNSLNPAYRVTKLHVGDIVKKARKRQKGGVEYYEERVENITIKTCLQGQDGYDLHFREGFHSYYADGFLCLLNYPEITLKNLQKAIQQKLSESERAEFFDSVLKTRPILENIFGKEVIAKLLTLSRLT